MSKLDELINTLCPDGVEYRPLGEVVDFSDGFPLNAGDFLPNGRYNVIRISNITSNVVSLSNSYIDDLPKKLKKTIWNKLEHENNNGSWIHIITSKSQKPKQKLLYMFYLKLIIR